MKYYIKQNLHIGLKVLEAGSIVDATEIPKKSLSWLLEQEIIIKVTKKNEAEILKHSAGQEEE